MYANVNGYYIYKYQLVPETNYLTFKKLFDYWHFRDLLPINLSK